MSGQGRLGLQPYNVWLVQKVRVTFDQSDAKLNQSEICTFFFPALDAVRVLFL